MKRLYTYKDKEKLYKACADAYTDRRKDTYAVLYGLIADWGLLADYHHYKEAYDDNRKGANYGA